MEELTSAAALRLRPFVEADDDVVGSWFADAGELRFFAGPRLRWPLDSGQWRSIRLDPSVTAWTAVLGDDDTAIGHGELITESPTAVRLARFAIAPALRGQGLGRALLALLADGSIGAGASTMTVDVHPDNTNAVLSYRTLGFQASPQSTESGQLRMVLPLAQAGR
ncbi:MAG TPA: GNAT family N-acetyltransferase [Galbitalea sp.]|jgi:ribosomal protein S18 acetylase RimI-like enzyme|nr:GNAT family N-acetyltransferase [Galbitalea sp.]